MFAGNLRGTMRDVADNEIFENTTGDDLMKIGESVGIGPEEYRNQLIGKMKIDNHVFGDDDIRDCLCYIQSRLSLCERVELVCVSGRSSGRMVGWLVRLGVWCLRKAGLFVIWG